ncbi:MAG: hypothetical protein ACM3JD_02485 [Rudaea sp.]
MGKKISEAGAVSPAGERDPEQYIVNPAGAVHSVDRAHALRRLRESGWRRATEAEIAEARKPGRVQQFDRPIAEPWHRAGDE